MTHSRIDRAIQFATIAHAGQRRKGSDIPYITHPYGVAMSLAIAGCAEDVIVAGLLHDTVEDCGVSLEELGREFGPAVAAIVDGCTEPEHKSLPWEVRKQHTIDYLKTATLEVKLVACADKLSNARAIAADLAAHGERVWDRFKRGRREQGWYYRGIAAAFRPEIESGLYPSLFQAFAETVEQVFGPEG